MARAINQEALDLVKSFEGFRKDAYLCPAKVWTIGYGHTGSVKRGQKISRKAAEDLLREDLSAAAASVEKYVWVELTDNQFGALASFTFNLGAGNLKRSTLRRKLNAGDFDSVPSELARWVKAGGKTMSGLVRRRAAEGALFLLADGETHSRSMPPMPQSVSSVDGPAERTIHASYLTDPRSLEVGCVDDTGDERYKRLSQNVPDGFIVSLQADLKSLGLDGVGESDGAFGRDTKAAVEKFQRCAGISQSGVVDRATKDAISTWLAAGHTVREPPGADVDVPPQVTGAKNLITPPVPHYSQGDGRWAERVLGRGSSIRREGCAVSCIAMILSHYGREVTPGILDAFLDANDGYAGNSVKWLVAGTCAESADTPTLKYGRSKKSPQELEKILSRRIKENRPTMVRVDYATDQNLTYNHFVVCIGKTAKGGFLMHDPATHRGDGYANPGDENIIQRTRRKDGYAIVQLDFYDPV